MNKELTIEEKVKIARAEYMKEYHKMRSCSLEYRLEKAKKSREWNKNNQDKVKASQARYWLKKFEEVSTREEPKEESRE